ncbi:MAG: hypothetical protein IT178_06580 [Acidobacteria bacterium]|nr:hypothetical protein [Acidobacteriota bacterium]
MTRLTGVAAAGIVAAAAWLSAQAPSQPVFRAGVDLIAIDVVVVDKDGQQVPSLIADDFVVDVDGRERAVVSSQFVATGTARVPGSPERSLTLAGASPTEVTADQASANLVVLAIDVNQTSPDSREQVRTLGRAILERLPAGARVAVVALPMRDTDITFSTNRVSAAALIDRVNGWSPRLGRHLPFVIVEAMGMESSDALWEGAVARVCPTGDEFTRAGCRSVMESDARALLQEVAARAAHSTSGLEMLMRLLQRVDGPKTVLYIAEELGTDGARVEVGRVARAAAAARARIHVLQPQPPTSDAGFTSIRYHPILERQRQVEGLELVADWSGGDVFPITPSDEMATRLISELAGRYQLMVETQPGDRDGKPHRIRVRVPGRRVTVRARREFVADNLRTPTTRAAPPPTISEPAAVVPPARASRRARLASFVVTIDPLHADRAATETGRVQRSLALAMAQRGFRPAESLAAADVRLELAGQRFVSGSRARLTFLTRVTVTAGARIAEIRGRNQSDQDIVRSSVDETARLVDDWLGADFDASLAVATERANASAAMAARVRDVAGVDVETLLPSLRRYVANYESSLAGIVAEEHYAQQYAERVMPFPAPPHVQRRETKSEMGFAWFPAPGTWFGFRDVLESDGKPVADRQQRLEELFVRRTFPSQEQLARVTEASARFNLGPARRNFNVPTTALLVASPATTGRFRFELRGWDAVDGVPVAVIDFHEIATPTIVTRDGHDLPSQGLLWAEPGTGRIRRTDLRLADHDIETRHTTWFTYDARLDLMVPSRMREVYDYVARADEYVETIADYSNVRRFVAIARQ